MMARVRHQCRDARLVTAGIHRLAHTVRSHSPARAKRGMVLLVVVLVVAIAIVVGAGVLHASKAEAASNAASLRSIQTRALAWSGVQALMAELAIQRDEILRGEDPRITREWTLFGEGTPVRGVVRLLPLDDTGLTFIESETAKLDVNSATEAMLANVPGLDAETAARIVEARKRRVFGSLDELRSVEGITELMLIGAEPFEARSPTNSTENRLDAFSASPLVSGGLASMLTVFSFDPNIQAGIGQQGDSSRGDLRVNLAAGWSDDLAAGIAKRFGQDAVQGVRQIMQQGTTFKRDGDIVAALRRFNVQPAEWTGILDCFTTVADPYRIGRVDLNRASEAVLSCIPGLDAGTVAEIVAVRDRLDAETRQNVAWPVVRGIVSPESFERAVDHLTTRSSQWRARIETGLIEDGSGWERAPGEEIMRHRMVVEVVIDIASQRPRVAYLRDVTMLEVADAIARFRRESQPSNAEPLDLAMHEAVDAVEPPVDSPVSPRNSGFTDATRRQTSSRGSSTANEAQAPAASSNVQQGQDRRHGRWSTRGAQR